MENDKKVVPVCVKCKYMNIVLLSDNAFTGRELRCGCPDAPYTDFVNGKRYCNQLNHSGTCGFYMAPGALKEEPPTPVGSITVDLTLNAEPFKKKMAELLAGL